MLVSGAISPSNNSISDFQWLRMRNNSLSKDGLLLDMPEEQWVAAEVPSKCQPTRQKLSDEPILFRQGHRTADPRIYFASVVPLHIC